MQSWCKFQSYTKSLPSRRQCIRKLNTSYSHKLYWHAKFLLMQTPLRQAARMPQLQGSISKLLSLPAPSETSHGSPARNYAWNSICDSKAGLCNNEQTEQRERGALCGRGRCQRYAMLAMATPGRSAVTPPQALNSAPLASAEPPTRPAGLFTLLT